jgi:hypothetical protein
VRGARDARLPLKFLALPQKPDPSLRPATAGRDEKQKARDYVRDDTYDAFSYKFNVASVVAVTRMVH